MPGLAAYADTGFSQHAPGYMHALHANCMTCHRLHEKDPADAFSLGNCIGCHRWEERTEGEPLNMLQGDEEPLEARMIEGPVVIPASK